MHNATRVTRVVLDVDRTISTGSIMVYGIILSNSTASTAEIEIEDVAGNTRITVTVPAMNSETVDFVFLADKGLIISGVGSTEVFASVFHSSEGA